VSRKLPHTPTSRIRSALRQLWMRSRERAACLKAHGNTCAECGVKASVAKGREVRLEVHHIEGVANWDAIFEAIRLHLLVHPSRMVPLCKECHKRHHNHLPANVSQENKTEER
jgi:predicted HNH restriction endonuclease